MSKRLMKLLLFIMLPLLIISGFSSWIIVAEKEETVGTTPTNSSVCYIIRSSNKTQYTRIEEALDSSISSDIVVLPIGFTTWGLSSNAFFTMRSRNKANNECINVESINDFINLSYIETKGEFVTSSYLNNKKNEVISIFSFENINTNVENNKINISYFIDVTNLIVDSSFEEIIYDNLINVGMTFEVIASVK
ncbi:MAG: hypothetical protein E7177_03520 [Erysipelotrichaceae bacterium]|nr:hypothetical protein [Erysipelotrichaceae bacterium]